MLASALTPPMAIDMIARRAFLAGLAAVSLPRMGWADIGSPAFLAAGKTASGFVLHGLTGDGESLFSVPLPARGHAAAGHPHQAIAVAFARRPGTYGLVIDCASGAILHQLEPPQGRQFNGHGVFSADGALLMTSEVVSEGSAGRIGLWETDTYRRVAEWDSGGIGPHDIKRLPGGRIVVANGGIQTDPADRTKLNLATMRPNLTLLSSKGEVLDRAELPTELRQNSIRHLALLPGKIAFAMQWEGDAAQPVPLLGLWAPGKGAVLCPPDDAFAFAMKGYAGSIAATQDGKRIALTSAPGGVVMLFDEMGHQTACHTRADLSGVAAIGGSFVVTDGSGTTWQVQEEGLALLSRHTLAWDNHLVGLGPA
ncbi:hypothetical protein SAMN05216227_105115 [Pseudorhodobacter antarcticus]|uniref:Twin-arginine translocation pathway signal n=2 Tax=Pseudorhodobacter antarcticus TaxID=1077947 RepID=A0A1H8M8H2_9RHOB|nr:hypothetical protein SAMN05216227_105115 [Pseudorhodobacter antarcticus]